MNTTSKNVILIGFMGAGKTSIGQELAVRSGRTFLDTDEYIEKKSGMTISHIFDAMGEEAFRKMETEALRDLISTSGSYVISVGGGLPMRAENRTLLKELGTVVYLKVSPETVEERLRGDTTRPLLRGDNPRKKIEELLSLRGPLYEEAAHLIVNADGRTPEEITSEIVRLAG